VNDCSIVHVIENEDFGLERVKSDAPSRKEGRCFKCKGLGKVRKCSRCANYFCEGTR
jgi:hypothetical protein